MAYRTARDFRLKVPAEALVTVVEFLDAVTDPATGQFFDVPWDQNPLSLDVSFRCGDTILFFANQDTLVPGGVVISVGRIDGTTQQGPFTGAETFEILQEVVFTAP